MRVLFDLMASQPWQYTSQRMDEDNQFHGGAEYTKAIFRHALKARGDVEIEAVYNPASALDASLIELVEAMNVKRHPMASWHDLQLILDQIHYDRFFSGLPNATYRNVRFGQTEVIYTSHGLRSLETPSDQYEMRYQATSAQKVKTLLKQLFLKRYMEQQRLRRGGLLHTQTAKLTILTDSAHSQYAHQIFFPEFRSQIYFMVYPPPTAVSEVEPLDTCLERFDLSPRGYILLVSGNVWVKNGYRAIKALDELAGLGLLQKHVVMTGVTRSQVYDIRHKEFFTFLPYVRSEELAALYKNAFCLLYPSLNEGFGYPPLESMRFGTPIVCSAVTSLPEVCGDAVLYVNPYATHEIQNRILQFQNNPEVWQQYSERALERYKYVSALQTEGLATIGNLILT
jgi:glycosyltransferase involved in cell wall biosynthesis